MKKELARCTFITKQTLWITLPYAILNFNQIQRWTRLYYTFKKSTNFFREVKKFSPISNFCNSRANGHAHSFQPVIDAVA